MSHIIYIGVDDTDVIGSVGTGRVARGLAAHLVNLGLGTSLGVSRHQLLVDERIIYTSHNSSKGITFETDRDTDEFFQPSIDYVEKCFQPGADPGLCICGEKQLDEQIIQFGKKATSSVLRKRDAVGLAEKYHVFLKGLGSSGEGVIGALAAVSLRSWGNEGRLVDLPGIHDITGLISVSELLCRTPIDSVQDSDGKTLDKREIIDSLDWLRPSLVDGRPVLKVKPTTNGDGERIWVSAETRNKSGTTRINNCHSGESRNPG